MADLDRHDHDDGAVRFLSFDEHHLTCVCVCVCVVSRLRVCTHLLALLKVHRASCFWPFTFVFVLFLSFFPLYLLLRRPISLGIYQCTLLSINQWLQSFSAAIRRVGGVCRPESVHSNLRLSLRLCAQSQLLHLILINFWAVFSFFSGCSLVHCVTSCIWSSAGPLLPSTVVPPYSVWQLLISGRAHSF